MLLTPRVGSPSQSSENDDLVRIRLLGDRTELGGAVVEELLRRGNEIVEANPEVIINVARQTENSLLHDGWAWKGAGARIPAQVAQLLELARREPPRLIVDASYGFFYGDKVGATEDSPRTAPAGNHRFEAALAAEDAIRNSALPVCTMRLGYGYGPRYEDLKRYRTSFRVLRPYYPGPGLPASWIHHDDAATAIIAAAERGTAGEVFNVADDVPVSLRDFIDHFGRHELHRFIYHLPDWSAKFLGGQIRKEQVALLRQRTTMDTSAFRERFEWKPRYASYREGLAQTCGAWAKPRDPRIN